MLSLEYHNTYNAANSNLQDEIQIINPPLLPNFVSKLSLFQSLKKSSTQQYTLSTIKIHPDDQYQKPIFPKEITYPLSYVHDHYAKV